jgi:hypothetical protein
VIGDNGSPLGPAVRVFWNLVVAKILVVAEMLQKS